jgi:hypothetical protein
MFQKQTKEIKEQVFNRMEDIDKFFNYAKEFSENFNRKVDYMNTVISTLLETDIEDEPDYGQYTIQGNGRGLSFSGPPNERSPSVRVNSQDQRSSTRAGPDKRISFQVGPESRVSFRMNQNSQGSNENTPDKLLQHNIYNPQNETESVYNRKEQSSMRFDSRGTSPERNQFNSNGSGGYANPNNTSGNMNNNDMFALFANQNANLMKMIETGKDSSLIIKQTLEKFFESMLSMSEEKNLKVQIAKLKEKNKNLKEKIDTLKEENIQLKTFKAVHEESAKLQDKARNSFITTNSDQKTNRNNECCERYRQELDEKTRALYQLNMTNQKLYFDLNKSSIKIQGLENHIQMMQEEFFSLYKNVQSSMLLPSSNDIHDFGPNTYTPDRIPVREMGQSLDSQEGNFLQMLKTDPQMNSNGMKFMNQQGDFTKILGLNDTNSLPQNLLMRRNYSFSQDDAASEIQIREAEDYDAQYKHSFGEKPGKNNKHYNSLDDNKFEPDPKLFSSLQMAKPDNDDNIFNTPLNNKQIVIQVHEDSDQEKPDNKKANTSKISNNVFIDAEDENEEFDGEDPNSVVEEKPIAYEPESFRGQAGDLNPKQQSHTNQVQDDSEDEGNYSVVQMNSQQGSAQDLVSVQSDRFLETGGFNPITGEYQHTHGSEEKKKYESTDLVQMLVSQSRLIEKSMEKDMGFKNNFADIENSEQKLLDEDISNLENFYTFSNKDD